MVVGTGAVRPAASPSTGPGPRFAAAALGAALLAAFFAVDPVSAAAFDAPKRLALVLGVAGAAAALALSPGRPWGARGWRDLPPPARAGAVLFGITLAWAGLAAVTSPRPALALAGLRWLLTLAALPVLGASTALEDGRGRRLAAVYVGAAAVSAALAVAQASGIWQPLAVESVAGRSAAFALVGNEGLLALALALASVAATARLLAPGPRAPRRRALAVLAVLLVGLAVTANLTGILAVVTGLAALLTIRAPRRAVAAVVAAGLVLALTATLPPMRERLARLRADLGHGDWYAVSSDRLAPWAAAVAMVRERPLTGFGPGTFSAEYVPHLVAAERRLHRRLVHVKRTSHYAHAHSEPLQAAAQLGLPGALAALAAALALVLTGRRALAPGSAARDDAVAAAALLAAAIPAMLLWFPLSAPVTALPLLLAAGRLWRLGGEGP